MARQVDSVADRLRRPLRLAILLLITLVTGLLGLSFHHSDFGPPALPYSADPPSITVNFDSNPQPGYLLYEELIPCDGGTTCGDQLVVTVGARPRTTGSSLTASVDLNGFLASCPSPLYRPSGTGFACETDIDLDASDNYGYKATWQFATGALYRVSDAYTSAALPQLYPEVNRCTGVCVAAGRSEQVLSPNGPVRADQVQMLQGPSPSTTASSSDSLSWFTQNSDGAPALSLTATDPTKVGNEQNDQFLSGILLGITGAGLLAFIADLLTRERFLPPAREDTIAGSDPRQAEPNGSPSRPPDYSGDSD